MESWLILRFRSKFLKWIKGLTKSSIEFLNLESMAMELATQDCNSNWKEFQFYFQPWWFGGIKSDFSKVRSVTAHSGIANNASFRLKGLMINGIDINIDHALIIPINLDSKLLEMLKEGWVLCMNTIMLLIEEMLFP